jgi:hypothetical protein
MAILRIAKMRMVNWFSLSVASLIFLVPSNLFYKFTFAEAYVRGLQVDYLIPKLYLNDIALIVVLVCWLWQGGGQFIWQQLKLARSTLIFRYLITISLILVLSQLLTPNLLVSGWYLLKLLGAGLLGLALLHTFKLTATSAPILSNTIVFLAISATILFQSLLAGYQFLFQRPLLSYYFLGEPDISRPIGLAKVVISGAEHILPYGTTAHPNVLGGVLALYLLLSFWLLPRVIRKVHQHRKPWLIGSYFALFLIGASALILTFSASAWTAFSLGLGCWVFRQVWHQKEWVFLKSITVGMLLGAILLAPWLISSLAQSFPDNPSLVRRAHLNTAAWQMAINNPIFGVGLNTFTIQLEKYTTWPEVVRFVQPAHHVGLLWLSETGLIGLGVLVGWGYALRRQLLLAIPLLASLTPIFSLDHYLLTLQTGLLLAAVFVGLGWTRQGRVEKDYNFPQKSRSAILRPQATAR